MILDMERFALHAKELGFHHPEKKKTMVFDCAFPSELTDLFTLAGISTDEME